MKHSVVGLFKGAIKYVLRFITNRDSADVNTYPSRNASMSFTSAESVCELKFRNKIENNEHVLIIYYIALCGAKPGSGVQKLKQRG